MVGIFMMKNCSTNIVAQIPWEPRPGLLKQEFSEFYRAGGDV